MWSTNCLSWLTNSTNHCQYQLDSTFNTTIKRL